MIISTYVIVIIIFMSRILHWIIFFHSTNEWFYIVSTNSTIIFVL